MTLPLVFYTEVRGETDEAYLWYEQKQKE